MRPYPTGSNWTGTSAATGRCRGVPIYFFHVRGGRANAEDEEGIAHADEPAARAFALAGARSLIAGDVLDGILDLTGRIDVEDEAGKLVFSLPFATAVDRC